MDHCICRHGDLKSLEVSQLRCELERAQSLKQFLEQHFVDGKLTADSVDISTTNLSYFTNKYRDYTTRGDFAPQIRYPEVLLTLAEAEARQAAGISQRAIDLLNVVRNRALQDTATEKYLAANFATKVALVKAILLERRIELLAEGKRWGDISRNVMDANYTTGGIPAKAINGANGLAIYGCGNNYTPGQAAIPVTDFKFIWPIPVDETIQNPVIKQNPSY